MPDAAGDFAGHRIKHLEMIQAIVARMSTNSTLVKRFAVLVTAAAVSFAKFSSAPPSIILLSAGIVLLFALLDAGYLGIERSFRALYDEVRNEPVDRPPDFRMMRTRKAGRFFGALLSWSVAGFYLALGVFLALASFVDGE